jgi:hypothetical protein
MNAYPVWLVFLTDPEGDTVAGVFSAPELAHSYLSVMSETSSSVERWRIEEWLVNAMSSPNKTDPKEGT